MKILDYSVILLYFALMAGVGFWYQRRASKNLDSYFLGGKSMHWLALALTGAVSCFDVTGTMWIVTLITLFGMKSMWNHWMWGFLMGAFFLAFMGKWVRRSRVMTGAEWMITRFGDGPDGRAARVTYSLMAIVTLTAFIGYAYQGIGKFAPTYIPLDMSPEAAANVCAISILSLTTLYVMLGGLHSVVISHIIQTVILTAAALLVAVVAYREITPEMLQQTLPAGWDSLSIPWRLESTQGLTAAYAGYEFFGALAVIWVLKGLLLNLGGPGQMYDFQLFLATRDARDAAKVGAAWSWFLVVRWAMAMGIALLAMTKFHGSGDLDPEKVMPMVLDQYLPTGLRGLMIAGMLAAFMSTFSATVNAAASYIVRDWWQPWAGEQARGKSLIYASYVATISVVAIGMFIGWNVTSIGRIFSWIMMELGAAFVIPNVLRWYWWRINGWGYAAGTLLGLVGAILVPFLPGETPLYVSFPAICVLSLVGCLVGTWGTRATDLGVLTEFYRNVRPFGCWGPIREISGLTAEELADPGESPWLATTNVLVAGVGILGIYLAPMYLVGHWHLRALVWLIVSAVAGVVLYFTWYRTLPAPDPVEP